MEGITYLAVAYLGMIVGLGIWTYTVFSRSNSLEGRIEALENPWINKLVKNRSISF